MELKPFTHIEHLTIYHNTKYYYFIDNIHINEIFSINNDILAVFYLDHIKNVITESNYIDIFYTNKITINNLIYKTEVKYITINEKNNQLHVYYIVIDE